MGCNPALGRSVGPHRDALLRMCRDADPEATGEVGWGAFVVAMRELAIEPDDADRATIMAELGVPDRDIDRDAAVVSYKEVLSPAAAVPAPAPAPVQITWTSMLPTFFRSLPPTPSPVPCYMVDTRCCDCDCAVTVLWVCCDRAVTVTVVRC